MTRTRLPNRRPSKVETLVVGDQRFEAGVSFDEHGQPKELFLDGPKAGSQISNILKDIAVVISVACQDGSLPKLLAKSVGRLPDGQPATVVGAALDFMVRMAPPKPRMAYRGIAEFDHR